MTTKEDLEKKLSRQAEDITRLLGSRERVKKYNRELRSKVQDLEAEIEGLDEMLCQRLQAISTLRAELDRVREQRERDVANLRAELEALKP